MEKKKAKALVLSALDEIAWTFNLRGSDIDFNPVFFSYAVITHDHAILFINEKQLSDAARTHLGEAVVVRPYNAFFEYLESLHGGLGLSSTAVRSIFRPPARFLTSS
jgi:Xaa-Pro aminopeptidase